MIEADDRDLKLGDDIRDILDGIWYKLAPFEKNALRTRGGAKPEDVNNTRFVLPDYVENAIFVSEEPTPSSSEEK